MSTLPSNDDQTQRATVPEWATRNPAEAERLAGDVLRRRGREHARLLVAEACGRPGADPSPSAYSGVLTELVREIEERIETDRLAAQAADVERVREAFRRTVFWRGDEPADPIADPLSLGYTDTTDPEDRHQVASLMFEDGEVGFLVATMYPAREGVDSDCLTTRADVEFVRDLPLHLPALLGEIDRLRKRAASLWFASASGKPGLAVDPVEHWRAIAKLDAFERFTHAVRSASGIPPVLQSYLALLDQQLAQVDGSVADLRGIVPFGKAAATTPPADPPS